MGMRGVFGVAGFVVLCVTGQADAAPPARPTKAEAIVRIHKLHLAAVEMVDVIKRAASRKSGSDLGVEPLDSVAVKYSANCAQSGTVSGTMTSQVTGSGTSSGSGTVAITFTAANCATSGGTLDGSGSMTYAVGESSTAAVTTAAYQSGTITVSGANAGRYQPRSLVVTTVNPKSGGVSATTIDGDAIIDGYPLTFSHDPVP